MKYYYQYITGSSFFLCFTNAFFCTGIKIHCVKKKERKTIVYISNSKGCFKLLPPFMSFWRFCLLRQKFLVMCNVTSFLKTRRPVCPPTGSRLFVLFFVLGHSAIAFINTKKRRAISLLLYAIKLLRDRKLLQNTYVI